MKQKLEEGLQKLRRGFQADGADLQLTGWNDGTAEVTLVFGPDVCEECILPKETIKRIVEQTLKEQVNELQEVNIIDPRETA
jgi:Fe-S cluster biogenesis protein NfuA